MPKPRPDVRVYGAVNGLPEYSYTAIRDDIPFDSAIFVEGVLTIEHEGAPVFIEPFLDNVVSRLNEDGGGEIVYIDNYDWKLTRYTLRKGDYTSKTLNVDDVMDKYHHE